MTAAEGALTARARIDELVGRAQADTGLSDFGVDSWREGLEIVGRTHTATRSKMNGAAAARLGNDQTPGRW